MLYNSNSILELLTLNIENSHISFKGIRHLSKGNFVSTSHCLSRYVCLAEKLITYTGNSTSAYITSPICISLM